KLHPICAPGYVGGPDAAQYWSELVGREAGPIEPTASSLWAVNGFDSNSGYLLPNKEYTLQRTRCTGSHRASLESLRRGEVDFAAIDGHVWERTKAKSPERIRNLKSLRRMGPSPAPPWVATDRAKAHMRREFTRVILQWQPDDLARYGLREFSTVDDAYYAPIRDLV
ncbi:MAG: PhnD/SsuA/transferrin family substrate-binding protein, partial [Myxococcota bacterium]